MVDVYYCYALAGMSAAFGGLSMYMLPQTYLAQETKAVVWLYRAGFSALAPLSLLTFMAEEHRKAATPVMLALATSGVACLGWGLRELCGRTFPRAMGMASIALSGAGVAVSSLLSASAFTIYLSAIFTLGGMLNILDQVSATSRRHQLTQGEVGLMGVLFTYTGIFVTSLLNVLFNPPAHYPEHGLYLPANLLPIGAGLMALMPLASATLAFSVINERLVRRLESLALTDELTGVWSRRGLVELGPNYIADFDLKKLTTAVVMIDIDHFKRINDSHGHAIGDLALKHVSATLRSNLRADALLSRYGGEEFLALVPVSDLGELKQIADRLRKAVSESVCHMPGGETLQVTVSIGTAFKDKEEPVENAERLADSRLYQAKERGRNQVVWQ